MLILTSPQQPPQPEQPPPPSYKRIDISEDDIMKMNINPEFQKLLQYYIEKINAFADDYPNDYIFRLLRDINNVVRSACCNTEDSNRLILWDIKAKANKTRAIFYRKLAEFNIKNGGVNSNAYIRLAKMDEFESDETERLIKYMSQGNCG